MHIQKMIFNKNLKKAIKDQEIMYCDLIDM